MARTSAIAKEATKKKFAVRYHSRCKRCGTAARIPEKVSVSAVFVSGSCRLRGKSLE